MNALIFYLLGSFALVLNNPSSLNLPKDFAHKVNAHLPGVTQQYPDPQSTGVVQNVEVDTSFTSSGDMIHLLYGMARKYWLEHQIFPVHSACVGNPKAGYFLIVGENGSGKSTTALNLIANYGAKLFSGDKTLIKIDEAGKMHAVAGTKVMTTRLDTDIVEYEKVIREEDLISTERNSFRLRDDFLEPNSSVEIRGIYLIRAYHTVNRNEDMSFPTNLFVLSPHFVDQERADVILGLGQRLFNGEISQENKERNMVKLVSAMKGIKVKNITGSLSYVAKEIAKDMETESVSVSVPVSDLNSNSH